MKKVITVFLVLFCCAAVGLAQAPPRPLSPSQQYLLAYQAGFPAGTHSMNMAIAVATSYSYSVSYYTFDLTGTGHISWNATDYNSYLAAEMDKKFESYSAHVDPQGTIIAAYMSIVASTNYAALEANASNGDMELGSYWGYKDALDALLLGL